MKNSKNQISRRNFIGQSVLGTAGILGSTVVKPRSVLASGNPSANSKVVIVKDYRASGKDGTSSKYPVRQEVVQAMIDAGICELTGINDVGEAWKSMFPDITESKKISIKVNCIASSVTDGLCSNPEVSYAIANGLTSMKFGDNFYPEKNITIWDRTDTELNNAGYTLQKSDESLRVMGTNAYASDKVRVFWVDQKLSTFVTETDYLINHAVAKDHSFAGVTFSLKNHYGSINNPGALHTNNCDPYVPELNALDEIKNVQKLCICDAIWAVLSGGPNAAPQVNPNCLLFSTDPVALDAITTNLLIDEGMHESKRVAAHYIDTAAKDYDLGNNDEANIDVTRVNNPYGTTSIQHTQQTKETQAYSVFPNYPNPVYEQTTLAFKLNKTAKVTVQIMDMTGKKVNELVSGRELNGYQRITWNRDYSGGSKVPPGLYFANFTINKSTHTLKIQVR